jgi:hypothetical protein
VIDDEEGVVTKRKFETAQIPVDDVAGELRRGGKGAGVGRFIGLRKGVVRWLRGVLLAWGRPDRELHWAGEG